MKKHLSIVLLLVLILTNTIAFAAPGDIIHTGLNKVYRKTIDDNLLVEDVLDLKIDKDKFFREIEGDKFVNIVEEENAHEEWVIKNMPKDLDLTNEGAVKSYILNQANKLEKITRDIAKDFNNIGAGITWEEYQGYHNAPKLKTPDDYSMPKPGFKEGSTKIATLKLPIGANKWKVEIAQDKIPPMKKDIVLNTGIDYTSGKDIDIDVGKYLVLYAVDKDNKIKAYENIKITENMINTPKESATKIEVGEISEGKKYAGAVVLKELNEKLPEGASKWQVFISPIPVEKVYKVKMADAIDYSMDEDIVVAKENELHPIANNFKKYLLLLAVNNEGTVQGYNTFEIGKENISKAPSLLIENTHYKDPIPGDSDSTTKFTNLHFGINPDENMKNAKSWKAMINDKPIPVPKLNTDASGTVLHALDEVKANIRDYLLLCAVDDNNKIKGYKIFHLTENMVKGTTADNLPKENYSTPIKGTIQGTTKIETLNLAGINDADKWMYKIGENLSNPVLNKIVEGSSDYIAGQNIKANMGDTLLLLATDNEGRVKAFATIQLDETMVKDPSAVLLQEGVNFVGPIKGSEEGSTKFENLSISNSIKDANKWMVKVFDEMPEIPELDSNAEGEEYSVNQNIKDVIPNKYLMLMAVKDNKIKGYNILRLAEYHIKMPKAYELTEENYSMPEKGKSPGTTRINKLNAIGMEEVSQWRYVISKEKYNSEIELDSIIPQTTPYRVGSSIRAEIGDYLLLLATDGSGRIKGYKEFKLEENQITKPNATLLVPRTNYTEPEAGNEKNTTRFGFLDFSTNIKDATKWMYKIGDKSFGNIELDSVIEGAMGYQSGENIKDVSDGKYLLLLATDNSGKTKAYREFRLSERNIRGGDARKLKDNENYTLEKGNKPGNTKFSKLTPLGIEGNIRWKYRLMDNKLPNDEKPYLNSIIENTTSINIGQDILIKKTGNDYGYLLLIAVDGSNRTKGYAEIEIEPSQVKEHAPLWEVALDKGSKVDSVKIVGSQPANTTTKYIKGYREFPTPAVDEILNGGNPYTLSEDILKVRIGEHIGTYAVDNEDKIKAFNSLEITQDNIKQGNATITALTLLEGNINNGGEKIEIKLEDAKWAGDIKNNKDKRDALYNGFKANSETQEWTKVINSLIRDGSGAINLSDDNTKLTISLPETQDYDIEKPQEITLIVSAMAIEDAINPIEANGSILVKPTVKAIISGDVVNSVIREDDIKTGGKTIVVELKDGDWIEDVNSIVNEFSGGNNWSIIAQAIKDENIVRNSSKKLTITLPKVEGISFGVNKEIISLSIPKALIQGAETNVAATPTFTLYPNVLQVTGVSVDDTVYLEAPDGRVPVVGRDIWRIKVNTGTLKDNITNKDIIVSGLPRGLKTNVVGVEGDTITIKVSGTAATKVEDMEVKVKVKGETAEEPNSLDSEDIMFHLKLNEAKVLDHVKYRLQYDGAKLNVYLVGADNDMDYSIDSTNGINGKWEEASDNKLIGEAKPMKIWVREKTQPKVFYQVGELKYGDVLKNIKVISYDYSNGWKLGLEGNIQEMEYSKDGGNTWDDLNNPTISLEESSDLRIRKKAVIGENGQLPSFATSKLNGIYLGNVNLNVAEGIIKNTTTNMEYSIDGNRFTSARNGNTTVKFIKGTTVSIRERGKGNEINYRELGQIGQMEFSETELNSISYNIKDEKIINATVYEYKIANEPWKDVADGTKIGFKPGSLQFRKKGNEKNLPSESREKAIISAPEAAPNLNYNDTEHTIEKIGTNDGNIYEYSINGGDWISGENNTQFEAGNEIKIRIKATMDKLPSQIQTIRFTQNLSFANVYLDAGKSLIMNTTAEMEYSLNSNNGLDGQWYKANTPNTNVPLKKDMTVWIRENKKPKNFKKLTANPMIEKIFTETDLNKIQFSIVDETISINGNSGNLQEIADNLQYRNGQNNWINTPYTKLKAGKNIIVYNVDFKSGKLEFRLQGDRNNLPSKSLVKTTIKAKASAPNVEVNYMGEKIVSINNGESSDWKNFEYNIDNSSWINGIYLENEDLSGEKILRIRTKATDKKLPSQEAVIHFKEKLPLDQITLSTHVKPLELNGTTTQMEYRINNVEWKKCNNGNTKLTKMDGTSLNDINVVNIIEIRDSQQRENIWVVYKK